MTDHTIGEGGETFRVPDCMEKIKGYRTWRVDRLSGWRLLSTGRSTVWPIGEPLVANHVCYPSERPSRISVIPWDLSHRWMDPEWPISPARGCTCGLYAYAEPEGHGYFPGAERGRSFHCPLWHGLVFGEVDLWGKVIKHARGYRAQFMQPTALYVFEHAEARRVELLEDRRNKDVVSSDLIFAVAAVYDVPVVVLP